jgi:hypothetical protein
MLSRVRQGTRRRRPVPQEVTDGRQDGKTGRDRDKADIREVVTHHSEAGAESETESPRPQLQFIAR